MMRNSSPNNHRNSLGFTIVEFMIATAVFSVIIMGVTAAILHISKVYQHSIYASNTQAAASNLVDTMSQAIKFSSGTIPTATDASGTKSYCIGNRQFLYVLGKQLDGSNATTRTRNAVITRLNNNCVLNSIVTTTPADSKELLGKGMRLTKLDVDSVSSPPLIKVTVRVVFGDDDLLCSPSVAGSCSNTTTMNPADLARSDVECRPSSGSQFCAVSELSTTVYRRL